MPVNKVAEPFEGRRLNFSSKKPYDAVLAALAKNLGTQPDRDENDLSFLFATAPGESLTLDRFKSNVRASAGPKGLMQLLTVNHGLGLQMHGLNGGRGVKRLLIGNPLTAAELLQDDLRVGLSAPWDLLVMEREDGGTRIAYYDPLAMLGSLNVKSEEFKLTVGKLAGAIEWVVTTALEE
jgi:uncharacterized protein (DUF302 family)